MIVVNKVSNACVSGNLLFACVSAAGLCKMERDRDQSGLLSKGQKK